MVQEWLSPGLLPRSVTFERPPRKTGDWSHQGAIVPHHHAALLAVSLRAMKERVGASWGWLTLLTLVTAASQASLVHAQDSHAYDSIIKPTYRSVFWQVTNSECTAAHSLDGSSGDLIWRRSPVDVEQEWSKQVTDKRAFYTLDSGPSVSAVSLDTGSVKWSWPDRAGWGLWRHWVTDLPQATPLSQPLPAVTAQLLLLRPKDNSSTKVVGVSLVNGSLIWEYDFLPDLSAAAAEGGLPPVKQTTVVGWQLGMHNNLYVLISTTHAPAPAPAASAQPQPATAASVGWVVSVNLSRGTALWVSGPLEQGVASVAVSEPVLLVTSAPDEAGEARVYGLDKVTGAMLYSLSCGGMCNLQVANTRVGLLTSSMTHPQPSLASLAAFDLVTGNVLWRGLPSSKLAAAVHDDCTLVATPRLYAYFTCTCNAHLVKQQAGQQLQELQRQPDAVGLCAFAVETQTGALGYELLLSDADSLPSSAARFNMQPVVLPDDIAFSGRRGVYLVPRMGMHAGQSPLQSPAVRLAWRLPSSNVLNAWDWLDTQGGSLIIHTSPALPVSTQTASLPADDAHDDAAGGKQDAALVVGDLETVEPDDGAGVVGRHVISTGSMGKPQSGFLARRHEKPKPKPAEPQTWMYALDIVNGTLSWSLALDMSVGPLHNHALVHNWGRPGFLLLDSCRPPLGDLTTAPSKTSRWPRLGSWFPWPSWMGGEGPGDDDTPGTSCCLTAVSAKDGSVQWQHCFDLDHACSLGLARSTATNIVYILLGVQAFVLCLGCIVGVVWGRRAQRLPQASIMHDPDSEDEALLVQVLPPAGGFAHHYTEHHKPLLSTSEQQAAS